MQKKPLILALLAGMVLSGASQAALIDRGGGLIYDNVLDITWLQNANLAATNTFGVSGINANGTMNWSTAQSWIGTMNALGYLGYSNWRLPTVAPVNGSNFNYTFSTNGSTDYSYNITSPNSELAYMYYVDLGLAGYYSPTGATPSSFGIFGNGTCNGVDCSSFGQNDVGLIDNLQAYLYWSGTGYTPNPNDAWDFRTFDGGQDWIPKSTNLYAWAVRPGDVAPGPSGVPEPSTLLLLGLAMAGMGALRRRG